MSDKPQQPAVAAPSRVAAAKTTGGAALSAVASLLAVLAPLLAATRPLPIPAEAYSAFALLAIGVSGALLARRPAGGAMLATFLPALPLAACVLAISGGEEAATLLAATALAFQARCLLVFAAARDQAGRAALAGLLEKRLPDRATVFVDTDIESDVAVDALREGHLFRLSPGMSVPADGLVTYGSGFVDESFLDGEESLVMKGMGSEVYAGTRNKNGTLLVRANAVGSATFSARLSRRLRLGTEASAPRLLLLDAAFTLATALLVFPSGPAAVLRVFLVASGASCLAVLARFELGLGAASLRRGWLWSPGGLRGFAETGMLVLRPEQVLSEGRPRLAAVEVCGRHSEDAVLAMLGPFARRLETPQGFALLAALRERNIPLQSVEFYQSFEGGVASGLVAGEEVRWLPLRSANPEQLGALAPFVREHLAAGEDVQLFERGGQLEAALAFRDPLVPGAAEAAEALRAIALPVLLVSRAPKGTTARLQTELGLEHAQGETGDAETEALVQRLTEEGLTPAWIQTGAFIPAAATVVASLPAANERAQLVAPSLVLPALTEALAFARTSTRHLRSSLFWIFGAQCGLLVTMLRFQGSSALELSSATLAVAGVVPGAMCYAWLRRFYRANV